MNVDIELDTVASVPSAPPEAGQQDGIQAGDAPSAVRWSAWFRCDSSFGPLPSPGGPGVYVVAEEIVVSGEGASSGARRMLAVIDVGATADLAAALNGLLSGALSDQLLARPRFIRFARILQPAQCQAVSSALRNWLVEASGPSLTPAGAELSAAQQAGSRQDSAVPLTDRILKVLANRQPSELGQALR